LSVAPNGGNPSAHEAEETIEAIHQGKVDAILFEGDAPGRTDNVVTAAQLRQVTDKPMPVSVWMSPIAMGGNSATLVTITDLSVHLFGSLPARRAEFDTGRHARALLARKPRHHAGDQAIPWR
jgi:hypothetical protein